MPRISSTGSTFKHTFQSAGGGKYHTECVNTKFVTVPGAYGPQTVPVYCGGCDHCRWSKRQAVANAVQMEIQRSDWALWVTLTIAPHPDRAVDGYDKRIEKRLMQLFQKKVRMHIERQTHSFKNRRCTSWRYIQCGEYGSKKGRAHYHAVIFGKGDKPDWMTNLAYRLPTPPDQPQRLALPEWEWGHAVVTDRVDGGVAFYLAKYMQKGKKSWTSSSNHTAIGGGYIIDRFRWYAETKCPVPMQNWVMSMPGHKGTRYALVRGAKRRYAYTAFCDALGVGLLSLAKLLPKTMLSSVVGFERHRREKALGRPPTIFEKDRIKKQVWHDMRLALGMTEEQARNADRPQRPKGWSPPYPAKFLQRSFGDGGTEKLAAA